ncbi:nicotinate phosphoribosyltransferase [Marinimicrobium locisalis]|uniref:nicotinate phosphoribosyltransferase n=1 Tax=Marinimicrobium locisalis TaxID=546022 RepID=UPI003221778D
MSYFGELTEAELGLFIDLYELSMAQAYRAEGMEERAVFTLHFRKLPPQRNFILACGQHYAALLVASLRFPTEQVERLRALNRFDEDFLRWLSEFRFSGDIRVMPEGTPVFPHEPMLEIEAPLAEGQLLETLLMNYVNSESVLATKASRMVHAAHGKPVVDFGMRRMHGFDSALRGVRAYRVAGLDSTSNVLGSFRHGLPASGTMAHSYIQAHDDEMEAFRRYAKIYPGTALLVDTYDTMAGIDKVIHLVKSEGLDVSAIRLDSGDLGQLAKDARTRLDDAGLTDMKIVVSSGLDEWGIQELVDAHAPIDSFAVGTKLGVSEDAPVLDLAYKLTDYAGEPRLKNSPGKKLFPGRKQVWRFRDNEGRYRYDEIGRNTESRDGEPLLFTAVRNGQPVGPAPDLEATRERAREALKAMPTRVLALDTCEPPYEVKVSDALERLYRDALAKVTPH